MLQSITFESKNVVSEKMNEVSDMIHYVVRSHELNSVVSRFKDSVKTLEDAHVGINAWAMSEEDIRTTLDAESAEKFIAAQSEYNSLKEELASLPDKTKYEALSVMDKTFICILAHSNLKGIKLDIDILPKNFEKAIKSYYSKGSMKEVRDLLRSIFNEQCGKDGDMFYGVRLSRSNFSDEEIRTCMAKFRGDATRKFDKDTESFGKFDWIIKDGTKSVQALAVTTLFAVTLNSRLDSYDRASVLAEKEAKKNA